ncbi:MULTISPECIES: 6-bladed beta-propeller [Parabacteroides]|uniref:6-bladed beta-propeller n=1 Tax=Parabacteroides leei TaxID=2939491 RepID=UPI00189AA92E|nr:6-bladed beta-propeller [Parabacteroides goldsteinii]
MKKTCLLLLLLVSIIYIKEGYQLFCVDTPVKSTVKGSLSDIAEEVIAIPLETNSDCRLKYATQIKRDREDLFLVSNRQLYRFNCSGKFENQVTSNTLFPVTDYVIDPLQKQLIVMDDKENVYYYDYEGVLLEQKSLAGINPLNTPTRMIYHDRHIWMTAQSLSPCKEKPGKQYIDRWLYKFDTTLHLQDARKLTAADLGRFYLGACFSPELSVSNGNVYAHTPSVQPEEILADTLYLISRNKLDIHEGYSSILPLCIAGRYLVSTYGDASEDEQNYTFCYDRREDYAYNVAGGFDDNFYQTGKVPDLQALDVYNNSFCYCRSGEELKRAFPDRTEEDNPVLFIVRMKA